MQGIYKITNIQNNKIYIGSSSKIEYRFTKHISQLLNNIHHSYKFQNDFNKYTIQDFCFSIIEIVSNEKELLLKEQEYINLYDSYNDDVGYNILPFTNYKYIKSDNALLKNFIYCDDLDKLLFKKNLNILHHDRMNELGYDNFTLSKTWFSKHKKESDQLRKNIRNYFNTVLSVKVSDGYYTSFRNTQPALTDKYTKNIFISLTNILDDDHKKNNLVFIPNIFMNDFLYREYKNNNIDVDKDKYALSILLMWINNVSNINKQVNIYIPSSRMRKLLEDWLC